MMVKISGLPPNIKCYDVKTLIKRECNIIDIILDDLVGDVNACKTIRVGLADDEEGCRVIKCLNGFRFGDKYIIKVEQVCKSSSSNTKQTDSGPADRYQPTNYHNYPGTNSSNDHKIGYPSNKSGNQSLTSQGPGNYDKGPYGSQGHWKESSQYITKTDDFRASTNFNVDQAGYQAGHNQNQWGNKNTSRPQNFDSFTAPNLTNTRDCRSPDQSRSVTMSTPLLTKILHNLTNPPQRLIQNDGSSSPPRRNSSFGRQESRNIGRPQSPRENPPQTRHRQPERPVSPGKRAMQQGWQSDFKQTPQRTKDVPSNRNISPPGQRTPAGRPKSPSWTAPIRYSPPRASARQQFPSSARVFDFRRPGEKSMSGPHVMQPPGPTQPGYTNVDNKNVRFPPFVRTNNPYEQYMENNPASSQARPQHIQSQETIQPMYSGGYPSSHKGNASQPAWGPVQKTSWQQETKRVFDPKLGDNVNLPPPVHMRSPRSPVRRGSSIGQPVWGETHNVQADNARNPGWRPDPFQETVAKRQSGAGNVQRFENSLGGRSDFYEGIQHPPPGSFRSNVDPQTNDYREPNSSTRSSKESFQFQRMQRPSSEMQEGPRWSKGRDEHRNDFGDAYKKNRDLSSVPGLRSIDHQNSRDHEANRPNSQTQLCARPPAEPEWDIDRMNDPMMNPKRDKAVEAIVSTILKKHQYLAECGDEERIRVIEELKNELGQLFIDMFGDRDISYIEIMIKYKAKFGDKDEEVMIENVLSKLSIEMRCLKRSAPEPTDIPAKAARRSPEPQMNTEQLTPTMSEAANVPDWQLNVEPPKVVSVPVVGVPRVVVPQPLVPQPMVPQPLVSQPMVPQPMVPQPMVPQPMVPQPLAPQPLVPPVIGQQLPDPQITAATQVAAQQINVPQQVAMAMMANQHNVVPAPCEKPYHQNQVPDYNSSLGGTAPSLGFNLYLCQENFEPFTDTEADEIKSFLIWQTMKVTETSRGWSPDITFKGLQSVNRYELFTMDEATKKWLLKIDYSELKNLNVLMYTMEELWYERAAIWLPGHYSKKTRLEPFEKLKLQNKRLKDVNIGKWKLVKQIVNVKGTRLYVDLSPTSARMLARYKMKLSYELQKVDVYLKASAVDKDTFDAGLKEKSVTDRNLIMKTARTTPMPVIQNGPSVVKITLDRTRYLTPGQTFKLREIVIYHLFRYLEHGGTGSTDFEKYGFISPNIVGIVPENEESKRWLLNHQFGKLHYSQILVMCGGPQDNVTYMTMHVSVPTYKNSPKSSVIFEGIKKSNANIKGLNTHLWKLRGVHHSKQKSETKLHLDVDIKSIEKLIEMNYAISYADSNNRRHTLTMKHDYSEAKFMRLVKRHKTEMDDSSVVNMEFSSDEDDVICLE
ncbi:uncharacterized protein LOC101737620 isoform X1 [Bombyx mori]|uniref:DUF4780 domain-containing protein n=1 Tax=Bombyx mori TaxID=7091 RepID=A0A8R2M8W7_BOMMO|nr:uncharacterized protein LOC101737620 isoform X1 [Bombyx mori]